MTTYITTYILHLTSHISHLRTSHILYVNGVWGSKVLAFFNPFTRRFFFKRITSDGCDRKKQKNKEITTSPVSYFVLKCESILDEIGKIFVPKINMNHIAIAQCLYTYHCRMVCFLFYWFASRMKYRKNKTIFFFLMTIAFKLNFVAILLLRRELNMVDCRKIFL